MGRTASGEAQLSTQITQELMSDYALAPEAITLMQRLGPRSHVAIPLVHGDPRTPSLVLTLPPRRDDLVLVALRVLPAPSAQVNASDRTAPSSGAG